MKSLADLSKEFKDQVNLNDDWRSDIRELTKKISSFIDEKKIELLLAWWAQYGFHPGEAVMVIDHKSAWSGEFISVRKATPEETERFNNAAIQHKKCNHVFIEQPGDKVKCIKCNEEYEFESVWKLLEKAEKELIKPVKDALQKRSDECGECSNSETV